MLKLIENCNYIHYQIEVDEYLPLQVNFQKQGEETTLYWRGGDCSQSLVEVGINEKVGSVHSITLTSFNGLRFVNESYKKETLSVCEASPIFDLYPWQGRDINVYNDRFIDDFSNDFCFEIGVDYVSIVFKNQADNNLLLRNGDVQFCFDANKMIESIDFINLQPSQIKLIKSFV